MNKRHSLTVFLLIFLGISHISATYPISVEFETIDGNTSNLKSHEGELLLVEAFNTECSHCIDYHPTLQTIYNEYTNEIAMLSISINPNDDIDSLDKFAEKHPTNWILAVETGDNMRDTFNIGGTPTTLLIDASGRLSSCLVGNINEDKLTDEIDNFLDDPTGYTSSSVVDGKCADTSFLPHSIFYSLLAIPVILAIRQYHNNKKGLFPITY